MPFDHIIMNPPYSGNLHLKILREAMKHIEKDGEVINLSPIRWLQDPLAEYKRGSDWKKFEDVRAHIESIEEIKATDAIRLFNAGFYTNLGIYHITSNGGWKGFQRNKLLDKLIFSDCPKFSYKDTPEDKPFKIVLPATHGHAGCDDWTEITSKTFEIARKVQAKSKTNDYIVMAFDTEKELRNFYDSLFLKVYKYIVKNIKTTGCTAQYIKFVPILPTYENKWTDADLYEYFDLTDEEVEIIENAIQ